MDLFKTCSRCRVSKPLDEFYIRKSGNQIGQYSSLCKTCGVIRTKEWRHYKGINKPVMDLRYGAAYLGNMAEKLFEISFPALERMPTGNPGYDFICDKGTFDVKGACLAFKKSVIAWNFKINYNTTPDYYVLIAFDYRETLNPLHWWIIPSYVLCSLSGLTITDSPKVLKKWEEFEKPLDLITEGYNDMKT